MALVALDGAFCAPIGHSFLSSYTTPFVFDNTIDATNEAQIWIGRIVTSDGGSHTLNTTGSSSLQWRASSVTFSNAGTTVKVGLAAVDTATGPPGRAVNAANVITFDVSKSMTGGGGGITANAWQTHVPDTGSKTVANGDLVAFCIQMTARGGSDTVNIASWPTAGTVHRPLWTGYVGGTYSGGQSAVPNCLIVFSDGAFGWFYGSTVYSTITTRTWNSGSATKEYGQLFKLPFPVKVYGAYAVIDPDGDFELVLYSDPLGTPVAQKTVSIDANTTSTSTSAMFFDLFSSPYSATADQLIGAVIKPGASNISTYYRTLASATHRIVDPWGTDGYGISRASGAFANANSSLEHYPIGLLVGAFDAGGSSGRAVQVNDQSLVGS